LAVTERFIWNLQQFQRFTVYLGIYMRFYLNICSTYRGDLKPIILEIYSWLTADFKQAHFRFTADSAFDLQ
jgi:hypothetical protein